MARYTGSGAAMSVKGLDGEEAWSNLHANHSRRTLGEIVLCAARMQVYECSERRESSESGNHAVCGNVEENDDGARRKREDSRLVETVGVAGYVHQKM